jgi:predicted DNA-binding WGR domain protein
MPDGHVRFYHITLTNDLLDVIVECSWGTYGTKRGSHKSHPVASKIQAQQLIDSLAKRRYQRGYALVN